MEVTELALFLVTVASFAFQISGASILLLWSIKKHDKKIEEMCLDQHSGPLWFDFYHMTKLNKDDLQANARTVYRNICAFLDILIGYCCAIFSNTSRYAPCCIFAATVAATVLIMLAEEAIINRIARRRYPNDQYIKDGTSALYAAAPPQEESKRS